MNTIKKTQIIGKVFQHLPFIDSTNAFAHRLIQEEKPVEGTLIYSPDQRAGRGQRGASWHSSPGKNITLSVILYPDFLPASRHFTLNQCISLGLIDFLSSLLPAPPQIKWPNDLYVHDKKIGGILLQNSLTENYFRYCIVGIGINVNEKDFPPELPKPTSLLLETGRSFPPENLLEDLCLALEKRYLQLKGGNVAILQQDYLNYLYKYREESWFCEPEGNPFRGSITAVDEDGKLEIALKSGEIKRYGYKEVIFL